MGLMTILVVAVVALAAAAGVAWLRFYRRARGARVVTCPETKAPAGVEVDPVAAAWAALRGREHLELQRCSRWPERAGCGQECLSEIASAPEGCLVRGILSSWFDGKQCALCGKGFGPVDWHTHKPALMNAERRTFEWGEIAVVDLPGVLRTHAPVCWDCHVIETLVRRHPERVVFRRP